MLPFSGLRKDGSSPWHSHSCSSQRCGRGVGTHVVSVVVVQGVMLVDRLRVVVQVDALSRVACSLVRY